jgi:glutathione S-transferase
MGILGQAMLVLTTGGQSADRTNANLSLARNNMEPAVPSYRLHYFPESGNSYKLALMLTLCGETFESVWTDFGAGVTRTPEWRRSVNEMGEIPVLEEYGVRLTQTAPILLRLAARYGQFGGGDESERTEILRWLFWDNHKLTGYMATYRFNRAFTPSPDKNVQAYFRKRIDDYLGILEQHLQARPFVVGSEPTVADLSMCGYLSFPKEESGYDLATDYPAIHTWLGRIAALPGWRSPYDLLPGQRLRRFV